MGVCNTKDDDAKYNQQCKPNKVSSQSSKYEQQQLHDKMAEAAEQRLAKQQSRGMQPTTPKETTHIQFQGQGQSVGGNNVNIVQNNTSNDVIAQASEQRMLQLQNRGIKS